MAHPSQPPRFLGASASSFPGMTSERRARRFPVLRQKSNVPLGARATRRARAFVPAEGGTPLRSGVSTQRTDARRFQRASKRGMMAGRSGAAGKRSRERVRVRMAGASGASRNASDAPDALGAAARAAGPPPTVRLGTDSVLTNRGAPDANRPVAAVPDATTTDAGTTPDAMTMPTVRQGWRECAGLWRDPAILQAR